MVRLDFLDTTWIQVRNGRGITLFQGQLNRSVQFPGSGGLQVRARRPQLVRWSTTTKSDQTLDSSAAGVWSVLAGVADLPANNADTPALSQTDRQSPQPSGRRNRQNRRSR